MKVLGFISKMYIMSVYRINTKLVFTVVFIVLV